MQMTKKEKQQLWHEFRETAVYDMMRYLSGEDAEKVVFFQGIESCEKYLKEKDDKEGEKHNADIS